MSMYAVIFSASIREDDDDYFLMAKNLRALAIERYGCTEIKSVTEGNQEIAVSYWPSLENIQSWKSDPAHIEAQRLGQERWYGEYKVQVVRVEREYGKDLDRASGLGARGA